jgi:O-Antigen ligase
LIEKQFGVQVPSREKWLVIGLVFAGGGGFGIAIARFGFGWRELIILLMGLVALVVILVPDDRVMYVGLGVGVVSIAFGWRTFSITPNLTFSPFEFIIWFLAGALALKRLVRRERLRFRLSVPMMLFLLFSISAFLVAWSKGTSFDAIVGYGKNVVMVAPFFLVIQELVQDLGTWKRIMLVAAGMSVYLSLTGLSLVVAPRLGRALEGTLITQLNQTDYFTRVGFAGWGPLAAWVFILVFGVVLGFWDSSENRLQRLIYLGILGVLGAGILVSGQRGAWLALLVGLVIYGILNPKRGLILLALGGILILLFPEGNFLLRFASAFDPTLFDASAADRYHRAGVALSAIANNPLGLGFGGLTFVHSDYLEIGASMGAVALGLFVAALGTTGWRIFKIQSLTLDNPTRLLARGVFIMFIILVVEMLSAGFVTLSFTAVVTWFFWAMSDQFAVFAEGSKQILNLAGAANDLTAIAEPDNYNLPSTQ